MKDDISRLHDTISRLTSSTSKYVETIVVKECFHGFRGEVLWQRRVAVFEIKDHPKATRVYAWTNKDGNESDTWVIVLGIPPINSAQSAVAAAMAASIRDGSFEVS